MSAEDEPIRAAWVAPRWSDALTLLGESASWLKEAEVELTVHGVADVDEAEVRALGATPKALAPLLKPAPVAAASMALQLEAQWAESRPDFVHTLGLRAAAALSFSKLHSPERRLFCHVGAPPKLPSLRSGRLDSLPSKVIGPAFGAAERWIVQGMEQWADWIALGVPEDSLLVFPIPTGVHPPLETGALGRGRQLREALGLRSARYVLRTDIDPDQLDALRSRVSLMERIATKNGAAWLLVVPEHIEAQVQRLMPKATVVTRDAHSIADLVDATNLYVDLLPGMQAPRRAVEACLERTVVVGATWAASFPEAENMGGHTRTEAEVEEKVDTLLRDTRAVQLAGSRAKAWAEQNFPPDSCRRVMLGIWTPRPEGEEGEDNAHSLLAQIL